MESATVKMKQITCNACGADAFEERRRVGEWHIGQCRQCALIYLNPMPFLQPQDFNDVADNFYYTQWQQEITPEKLAIEKRGLELQLRLAAAFGLPATGRLLDIGCGPGLMVRAAVELGWEAMGLDIDPTLIRPGKERFAVDLRCADLLECRLPADHFDHVRLKFVLEHLPNPYEALVEVQRLLKPGGVLLIIVPNEEGLLNQIGRALGRGRTERYGTLIPPHHLHAYAPATLRRLVERAGLTLHELKTAMPTDPAYATTIQLINPSLMKRARRLVWACSNAIGRGSVLVAYAGKPKPG